MTVVDSGTFPDPVEVEVDRRVWDLGAYPAILREAARQWRAHADVTDTDIDEVDSCDADLRFYATWASRLVERYRDYRDILDPQLEALRDLAKAVAAELADTADVLQRHQKRLDGMLSDLTAQVPASDRRLGGGEFPHPTVASLTPPAPAAGQGAGCVPLPPTHVVFQARSFDDLRRIEDSKAEAKEERSEVDSALAATRERLSAITAELDTLSMRQGPCIPPGSPGNPGTR